ncbi:hypothetical protein DFH06DRAFT_924339, partial [Mycena polygramma]
DDIDAAIAGDQDHHIRHEAIEVASHEFPFKSNEAAEIFYRALDEVKITEIVPLQLGVAPAEWETGAYPETEAVKVGKKEAEIILPFAVWWPRAVAWAQGLEVLTKI